MAERILPQPDSFATAPPADVSILEHYAGTFEAVYILLHPFIDASEKYADMWVQNEAPNQPIRMDGDTLVRELGQSWFKDAAAAWNAIR